MLEKHNCRSLENTQNLPWAPTDDFLRQSARCPAYSLKNWSKLRIRSGSCFQLLWSVDTVLWLCPSQLMKQLKWLSSLPILMQESFWWWQCSDRCIIFLFPPYLPPPPQPAPLLSVPGLCGRQAPCLLTSLSLVGRGFTANAQRMLNSLRQNICRAVTKGLEAAIKHIIIGLHDFETSLQKSRTDYMVVNRLGNLKLTDSPWSLKWPCIAYQQCRSPQAFFSLR